MIKPEIVVGIYGPFYHAGEIDAYIAHLDKCICNLTEVVVKQDQAVSEARAVIVELTRENVNWGPSLLNRVKEWLEKYEGEK
jgi:hypothetical protein